MVILVRYGELALKSRYVRRQLEDRLVTNIQDMFAANGVECIVRRERGRVYVHAGDEPAAVRLLRRVFGIVSVSPAKETSSDLEALARAVLDYARGVLEPGMTFAIRARRSGQHPYTSQDLGRVLGQALREGIPGLAVDLDAPDGEVHVEVRDAKAYVFREVVDGPGGLPLGSQGEVVALVEDDAGMVAAWMMMRRGCATRVAGREPFLEPLRRWSPGLEVVEPGAAQEAAVVTGDRVPVGAERGSLSLHPLAGLSDSEVEATASGIRNA